MRKSKLLYVRVSTDSPTRSNRSSQSEWDDESDEEEKSKPITTAAPPKKKRTLKQVLAEKEAEKAARIERGEYDEEELVEMHPRERALLDKERELQADLKSAADLFGGMAVGSSE